MSGFVLGVRLAAAVLVLCAVAAGQGWFLYGLVRQNGRVLARLENLEQRIRIGGPPGTAGLAGVRYASGQGPVRGLAVGVPAPEFELPAVDGRRVSLRALLGRGFAGAAPLLSSRVRSLRRTAPAGGRLAATASRPPHGCAGKPAMCQAEGRHAGDTWVARCAFASQSRNRRGLPGKRHPERSADRRQRKNREPPGRRRRQSPSSSTAQPPAASRPSQRRHAPPAPRDQAHKTSPDLPPAPRHPALRGPICRSLQSAAGGSRVSQCRYRTESPKTRSALKGIA